MADWSAAAKAKADRSAAAKAKADRSAAAKAKADRSAVVADPEPSRRAAGLDSVKT
jgi:hypothetical protein